MDGWVSVAYFSLEGAARSAGPGLMPARLGLTWVAVGWVGGLVVGCITTELSDAANDNQMHARFGCSWIHAYANSCDQKCETLQHFMNCTLQPCKTESHLGGGRSGGGLGGGGLGGLSDTASNC